MTYEIIQKIIMASGISAGENVLIHFWGDDKDKNIANNFMIAWLLLALHQHCYSNQEK